MGFTKQSQLKAHWPSHYPPEDSFLEVEHEIE